MSTLVIAPSAMQFTEPGCSDEFFHVEGPGGALTILETEDIERIVFDTRSSKDAETALESLIALMPVTTRLLAIVEQLPGSQLCADAGVIYLTPPVNHADVAWFLSCGDADPK